jgi:hypothetical protein
MGSVGLNKVGKLVRMARLARFVKVFHIKNELFQRVLKYLSIGPGTRRLVFMTVVLILVQHAFACVW